MPLRWKLLLLLLLFAAAPMLGARLYNASAFRAMRADLVRQTNATLVERARQAVALQVQDHARHIRLQEELLEMAVQMQATGLAWKSAELSEESQDLPIRGAGGMLLKPGMMRPRTLRHRAPEDAASDTQHAVLDPVFEAVTARFGGKLLWQGACLPRSPFTFHPPPATRHERATLAALLETLPDSGGPYWTDPFLDPLTGQLALTVSMGNATAGFAVCAVAATTLLHGGGHLDNLSPQLETMLVRPAPDDQGLTVLAVQERGVPALPAEQANDHTALTTAWRQGKTVIAGGATMLADLKTDQAGTAILQREDDPQAPVLLWAYAPLGRDRLSLLASLPLLDVTAETGVLQAFIDRRLADLRTFSATSFVLLMVLAFFCSLIVSRRMHLRVVRLLHGFAQVARGNFAIRVDTSSRDELGQLARSFNAMVPALEERLRIMEALDLAHTMQQRLLPQGPPAVPGLELAGACLYCEATGGDFYDFLTPSARAVDVVVGDVSGHGLSAALLMATTRASLRQRAALRSVCCGEVRLTCNVNDVNRQLCRDLSMTGNFVTLACLRIVPRTGEMAWIRCGHDPAMLLDPASGEISELRGAGIPLGVEEHWRYEEQTLTLPAGHLLAIGTDGIWETQDPAGERYGKDRFRAALTRLAAEQTTLQAILDGLLLDLAAFRQGAPQEDDVTLVLMRRRPLDPFAAPSTLPLDPADDPDHPDDETTCPGGRSL